MSRWTAHGRWVAEYFPEQPEEPEPLFRVDTSENAATIARIYNDLTAERDQARADVSHLSTAICDALEGIRQRWPMVRVEEVLRSAIASTAHPREDER